MCRGKLPEDPHRPNGFALVYGAGQEKPCYSMGALEVLAECTLKNHRRHYLPSSFFGLHPSSSCHRRPWSRLLIFQARRQPLRQCR